MLCPSGGPAGQNTRRKDRSACPSGGPAGQAPKETTDSKMPRSHSLCGDSLCGDQKSSRSLSDAPPARSQSARENGDHSEMVRCACGAVTVCLCVALATSHTLLQHLRLCGDTTWDSLSEDQKSFRSLSDAPPARAQSARGAADVSGVMRRASPRSNSAPSDPKYSAS